MNQAPLLQVEGLVEDNLREVDDVVQYTLELVKDLHTEMSTNARSLRILLTGLE